MNLNQLFKEKDIDPDRVIVLRHTPKEPKLLDALPRLADMRPELFNAYQETQGIKLERAMDGLRGRGYVASFIGHQAGKAVFVGLYKVGAGIRTLTHAQFSRTAAYRELMKDFGLNTFSAQRQKIQRFNLRLVSDFYPEWKGRLIVRWPPPSVSWWRHARSNEFQVDAVVEESKLSPPLPPWHEIEFGWEQLQLLPPSWKDKLKDWRGIYYIFDLKSRKGYVGSAYGEENLLGRWAKYAASGHGGNRLLRERDPRTFRFSILERVSPDMDADQVIQLETSWKKRLHSRYPNGLNDN